MSTTNPRSLIEDALSTVLEDLVSGLTVHRGQSSDDRTVPAAIVYATSARVPDGLDSYSGNFEVTVEVQVASSAMGEDALSTHRSLVAEVRDAVSNVAAIEEAFPEDAHLYDIDLTGEDEGRDEMKFGNTLQLTALLVVDLPLD